ncbi:MAG: hypothetical protein MZV70_64410 [Desulfobacterales bacterium]|nr:hypothetical protein [Desulfobacterales bacterium]
MTFGHGFFEEPRWILEPVRRALGGPLPQPHAPDLLRRRRRHPHDRLQRRAHLLRPAQDGADPGRRRRR